ncbi:conserved hypothetical protein [delta proteobacterium NaphS2]|nr:conserved hypothetical protein [delta proteobacterium NaphS2]
MLYLPVSIEKNLLVGQAKKERRRFGIGLEGSRRRLNGGFH